MPCCLTQACVCVSSPAVRQVWSTVFENIYLPWWWRCVQSVCVSNTNTVKTLKAWVSVCFSLCVSLCVTSRPLKKKKSSITHSLPASLACLFPRDLRLLHFRFSQIFMENHSLISLCCGRWMYPLPRRKTHGQSVCLLRAFLHHEWGKCSYKYNLSTWVYLEWRHLP